MKLLFVSHLDPFKPQGGDAQRLALFLRACCKFADKVDLIALCDNVKSDIDNCEVIFSANIAEKKINKHKQLWGVNPQSLFPQNDNVADIVNLYIERGSYDFIAVKYIPSLFKYGLMDYADRLIVDVDDHPADEFRVYAKQSTTFASRVRKNFLAIKARILVPSILSQVKYSFFANPNQVIRNGHCAYLPNIPYNVRECNPIDFKTSGENLLFVGDLNYSPNYLGVAHFIKDIFPKIKQSVPNCTFMIAGNLKNEATRRAWSEVEGVQILGFVDNLHKIYELCRVVVAPIYHGGGSNIKVIEALSMNRACVTTPYSISAFRMQLTNDDLCVASDDKRFAECVTRLLRDEEYNRALATHGCQSVKKYFSIDAFNETVKKALQ